MSIKHNPQAFSATDQELHQPTYKHNISPQRSKYVANVKVQNQIEAGLVQKEAGSRMALPTVIGQSQTRADKDSCGPRDIGSGLYRVTNKTPIVQTTETVGQGKSQSHRPLPDLIPICQSPFGATSSSVTSVGIPMTSEGIPRTSVGIPMTSQGIPRTSVGIPMTSEGIPMTSQGIPRTSVGIPMTSRGTPSTPVGIPMTSEGIPMTSGRNPLTSQGIPMTSQGLPTASEGNPLTSQGIPMTSGITSRIPEHSMASQGLQHQPIPGSISYQNINQSLYYKGNPIRFPQQDYHGTPIYSVPRYNRFGQKYNTINSKVRAFQAFLKNSWQPPKSQNTKSPNPIKRDTGVKKSQRKGSKSGQYVRRPMLYSARVRMASARPPYGGNTFLRPAIHQGHPMPRWPDGSLMFPPNKAATDEEYNMARQLTREHRVVFMDIQQTCETEDD